MKKSIIFILSIFMLCGCGKIDKSNIIKEFSDKLSKSESYKYDGTMQIISNEEEFNYKIEVSFLKDNYYKVLLYNTSNDHEQIILRNEDGVYVITPSLNKSFKFQSEWPDNSSQAYILKSILKDLNNDKDVKYEKSDDKYILTTKVNYPNNSNLLYEKIYFDKNVSPVLVEVYDKDDNIAIKVSLNKIDYKAKLQEDDFALEEYVKENNCSDDSNCEKKETCNDESCTKTTSQLDTAIFPLYVPYNSSLTSSEVVETDNGNRQILSFAGDSNFIIVEEVSKVNEEMEIIPVYGDPHVLANTVAAMGANSIYWTDNNVDFYLASNDLSGEEMLTIAESMVNSQIVLQSK